MKKTHLILIFSLPILFFGIGFILLKTTKKEIISLQLGAYTAPREAFNEIIPRFETFWKAQTGKDVKIKASYLGSSAQSRAIVDGFEADIAVFSLDTDVQRLENNGLIRHNWKSKKHNGYLCQSVVVFASRPGSSFRIQDWKDLATSGAEIMMANPKTSGGAQWNFMAFYGAALKGLVPGYSQGKEGAFQFSVDLFRNVLVLDKGARESIINFERGMGDVAITYENEIYAAYKSGINHKVIIPSSSIRIDVPIVLVDYYVDLHGVRDVAEGFLDFLWNPASQRSLAEYGFRPINPKIRSEYKDQFPLIDNLLTIQNLGGWEQISPEIFGPNKTYEQVLAELYRG